MVLLPWTWFFRNKCALTRYKTLTHDWVSVLADIFGLRNWVVWECFNNSL